MTARSLRPVGAEYGALLFLVPLFALYGNLMPLGAWGYLLGAVLGAIWSLVLILAVRALRSDPARASIAADATLLLSTVGLGAVAASGLSSAGRLRSSSQPCKEEIGVPSWWASSLAMAVQALSCSALR